MSARTTLWLLIGQTFVAVAGAAGAPSSPGAAEPAAALAINPIADIGFSHSEIPAMMEFLSDQIGGRMTNSPAMRRAESWASGKFTAWGLKEVRREGFDFGRGWWIEASHVRLVSPRPLELKGIPVAWTPATAGVLSAPIMVAPMSKQRDFAAWKGKLAGKIVLVTWPAPPADEAKQPFKRYSESEMAEFNRYEQPFYDPETRKQRIERFRFTQQLDSFLADEGAVAIVSMSRSDGRLVHGEGRDYRVGHTARLPKVELAAEDYRRLARLAKVGEVKLELENRVHFEDADHNAYNIIAEIPGRDPKAAYVMAGAHLDSWVAGDGAADNGAGSVMVMEAARILAKLNIRPRRTIRFVLWSGEEQGLLGSLAYIEKHLAHFAVSSDPALQDLPLRLRAEGYPAELLPGFKELDAYFNIDNGSGRIRGIYAEDNLEVTPILRQWLTPFASMGAGAVVAEPTYSTDHESLSELGLPAFQFIQDPLDYSTRVHHTDLDTYDHLRIEDMKQGAVILASVLYSAAEAEKPLPRRPVPTKPDLSDPFSYPDPSKD